MTLEIRPLLEDDRAEVDRILSATGMFTDAEIEVADELLDIFLHKPDQKDYQLFVACQESRLCGYVCFGPTPATEATFDLYWIAVDPELQGQGIGKQLLRFAEQECQNLGAKLLIIETSSKELYRPTQAFYLHNGYQIEARIKDFYATGDDRLIFTRRF
jgi:ribosomal protein S18 acetylase RimI-like enzyme